MEQQTTLPNQTTIPLGRYAGQPIGSVPKHQLQWMTAMNVSVSDKIAALLERTDKIKRGSEIGRPTKFDARGEAAARAIAAADRDRDWQAGQKTTKVLPAKSPAVGHAEEQHNPILFLS